MGEAFAIAELVGWTLVILAAGIAASVVLAGGVMGLMVTAFMIFGRRDDDGTEGRFDDRRP